jgi:RNA polymerase sigma-70 factor (ECF subfamily)
VRYLDFSKNLSAKPYKAMTFESLFRENFRQLTVYAIQFVREKTIAEDIVQELFVSLFEKKDTLKVKSINKSYLYKAVHNRCLNHNRDQKLRREMNPGIQESMIKLPEDPHELAMFIEFQDMFLQILKELPEKRRQVFEMSRIEGKSSAEIADNLNLSKRTVEKHIQLALKRFRKKLIRYMNVLSVFII